MNLLEPAGNPTWTAAEDKTLRVLQVAELYGFALVAALSSYFGAFLTLGVLIDTGDSMRGMYWFSFATGVTMFRLAVIRLYQHRGASAADPKVWADLMVVCNLLAGIQWGILGTILFPAMPGYRELFTLMVITCYVGGSVTAYASVKWAHPALALPATIPTSIWLFFVRDGVHAYAGAAALFFSAAIVYYAFKQHRYVTERLRLIIQNRQLLAQISGENEHLQRANQELAHRAEMRQRIARAARDDAHVMSVLFRDTPLAMAQCDSALRLIAWNGAAERLFGYTFDEAHGRSLVELLVPEERHANASNVLASFNSGGAARSVRTVAVTKDGRTLDCTCHLTPVPGEGDEPARVVIAISDIEDRSGAKPAA